MDKPFPWMDKILEQRKFEIKWNRKDLGTIPVEFYRIADDVEDQNTFELQQKDRIRKNESEKMRELLKAIFAENIVSDCIKQLEKIDYRSVKSEPLRGYIEQEKFHIYKNANRQILHNMCRVYMPNPCQKNQHDK